MSHPDPVIDVCKPAEFTIDGRAFRSTIRWRAAADLLELAGLDPDRHQLRELRPGCPQPRSYAAGDIVGIRAGTRFTSQELAAGAVDRR